ncbi:MAG: cytochrome P460 family protein [Nitrospirota bacterium]|jgi:hypothetical protein
MRNVSKIFLILAVILGLTVAAFAIHETQPAESAKTLPRADAGSLWTYISRTDPYHQWDLWPGKGKLYEGREPHGAYLTLYTNDTAHFAAQYASRMKDGAILVKENYNPEKKLVAITVMYKIKGYNPSADDWFFAKYTPEGEVQAGGKVKTCIDCHGTRENNDFIFTGKVAPY